METEKLVKGVKQRLIIAGVLGAIFYPCYLATGKKTGPAFGLMILVLIMIPVFLIMFMGVMNTIGYLNMTPQERRYQDELYKIEQEFDKPLHNYDENHIYAPGTGAFEEYNED